MTNSKEKNDKSLYQIILSRRSIRRFQQNPIEETVLRRLVNAARVAPSGANLQPLEYVLVINPETRTQIFETLSWAGYLKPKWTPPVNERPTAYIIILVDEEISQFYSWDIGLAAENIMLAAEEEKIGSCMLLKIKREQIQKILEIPNKYRIDSVIALGYPAEDSVVEPFHDSVEYWRDENGVMHVPKKPLKAILHINRF
jgi:nitroreductase